MAWGPASSSRVLTPMGGAKRRQPASTASNSVNGVKQRQAVSNGVNGVNEHLPNSRHWLGRVQLLWRRRQAGIGCSLGSNCGVHAIGVSWDECGHSRGKFERHEQL